MQLSQQSSLKCESLAAGCLLPLHNLQQCKLSQAQIMQGLAQSCDCKQGVGGGDKCGAAQGIPVPGWSAPIRVAEGRGPSKCKLHFRWGDMSSDCLS